MGHLHKVVMAGLVPAIRPYRFWLMMKVASEGEIFEPSPRMTDDEAA